MYIKKNCFKMFICAAAFAAALTSCKKDGDALKGIEFDEDEITLAVGEEYDLTEILTAVPSSVELPKCTYASDDKKVATVGKSNGKVKAVAAGEATITATVAGDDRKTADITVTVKPPSVAVTGVTVTPQSLSMRIGETQTLAATVTPAEAADKAVTWSSDAPAVAFVNPVTGEVTALSVGPAVITATTRDGNKQAFCAVTVSAAGSDPTTFTLTGTIFSGSAVAAWPNVSASFDGGDTYAVTASITNRQFSLTLPATNSLGGFFASTPSGVTISPSNAKFGWVWLYARSGTQKSEMTLATLSGMISIIDYIYADMDVNITGSYTSSTYTYTLNMQMKKGWNIIVLTDNGNNTCNESIAASVPSGAVWISEDDLGSSSSQAQAAGGREASIKSGFAELFKNGINEGLKIKK